MLLWNQGSADPIRAAEALIKARGAGGATARARHACEVGDYGPRRGHSAGSRPAGARPRGRGDGGCYARTGIAAAGDKSDDKSPGRGQRIPFLIFAICS